MKKNRKEKKKNVQAIFIPPLISNLATVACRGKIH